MFTILSPPTDWSIRCGWADARSRDRAGVRRRIAWARIGTGAGSRSLSGDRDDAVSALVDRAAEPGRLTAWMGGRTEGYRDRTALRLIGDSSSPCMTIPVSARSCGECISPKQRSVRSATTAREPRASRHVRRARRDRIRAIFKTVVRRDHLPKGVICSSLLTPFLGSLPPFVPAEQPRDQPIRLT